MQFSIILLSLISTTAYGQIYSAVCGKRFTNATGSLTTPVQSECMYFLDNDKVTLTGTALTLETGKTFTFLVPGTTGTSYASQTAAAYTDYIQPARTVVIYTDTSTTTTTYTLTYNPTVAATATATTLTSPYTCGGVITTDSGTITQPTLTAAAECIWIFTTNSSKIVTLNVTSVDTTGKCATEFLQINKFSSTGDRSMILFCTGMITPVSTVVDTAAVLRYKVGAGGSASLKFNINYALTVPTSGAWKNPGSFSLIGLVVATVGVLFVHEATRQ
ncbi:hypothetical protein D915_002803 [Fasciola hepatica]|uniref:CUB domain-containing protein n=1 Tax=Fasciola hepatica TaxID=6192 RepID=A0A4E0RJL7_FASHE|nr:hypothetical protein D915_002803 [Fasciola hepatica]